MYRLIFITSLLVSLVQPQSNLSDLSISTSRTTEPSKPRDPRDSSENCIVLCLTATNVLIFGVIVALVLCICAVICQQQPREMYFLVDRIPEQNPALRPAAVNIDPKIHSGKSPVSKDPIVSEPLTPKQTRPMLEASPENGGAVKKSVQIEISPQDNVPVNNSRLYAAQESIEDDPVPIVPIGLPLKDQKQQTPFVRPHSVSSPVGAVANAVGIPAASNIPIVIAESSNRAAGSTPAANTMPA